MALACKQPGFLSLFHRSVMSDSFATPWTIAHQTPLCPWDFPGKNTEVGCQFFLQGIFPDPGIEPVSPALAGGFFATEPQGQEPGCRQAK